MHDALLLFSIMLDALINYFSLQYNYYLRCIIILSSIIHNALIIIVLSVYCDHALTGYIIFLISYSYKSQ